MTTVSILLVERSYRSVLLSCFCTLCHDSATFVIIEILPIPIYPMKWFYKVTLLI